MTTLLERLKGEQIDPENSPENTAEIPDLVPAGWADDLPQDPPPGKTRAPRKLRQATTSGNVTPALRKRIAAEIEAYIQFTAIPIVMRDETCGTVLHEQAAPIADAITTILARYPDLAHKFLATGVLGDWIKLAVVLQPVLKTVWEHHVSRKPEGDTDGEQPDFSAYPIHRPGQ